MLSNIRMKSNSQKERRKQYLKEKTECQICGSIICRIGIKRHNRTKKCKWKQNKEKYLYTTQPDFNFN